MHFNLPNVMILAALLASLILVFRAGDRIPAIIALVAAGLEALLAFRLLTIRGPASLGLILSAVLAGAGAWAWLRASSKPTVTGATVVTLIGLIQFLVALRVLA